MSTPIGAGTIVKSNRMHGIFGTVEQVRPQHHRGAGWGQVEYLVRNGASSSWIDEHQLAPAGLEDIVDHYQVLMQEQADRITELRKFVFPPRRKRCTQCDTKITKHDSYNMCEDCIYHAERSGWTPADGWE